MSAAADALMGIFGFKRVEDGMKTDRELLELAAKAAGLDVVMTQPFIGLQIRSGNLWNPLADDGDALRLAVKLEMDMCVYADGVEILSKTVEQITEDAYKDHKMDVCAATRRAIVRAAAAIGEGME